MAMVVAAVGVLGITASNAVTVSFDDANRAPSDLLQIEGVTITGDQVATVSGTGLGSGVLGSLGSVDRVMHYSAGQMFPDRSQNGSSDWAWEGLQLSVDGHIDSVTVQPYFSVVGSAASVSLPFEMSLLKGGNGLSGTSYQLVDPSQIQPVVFNFPDSEDFWVSSLTLQPTSDFGQEMHFLDYRRQNSEEQTFMFGFTIKSLDYTPDTSLAVPEPNTTLFMCLGLLGLLFARRKLLLNQKQFTPALKRVQTSKTIVSKRNSTGRSL